MLVRVRRFSLAPMWVRVRKLCLELRCVRLDAMWLLLESCEPFESFWPDIFWPDIWPAFMPSLEAPCPDILPLVPPDILVLAPAWVSAPPFGPFSTAQEGVAAANAIAPTTPSMSGSFLTALFMIAPPCSA